MLPESKATNFMAAEIAKLIEKGIDKPFVHVSVTHFSPEWYLDKTQEGYLLQPTLLSPSLMRWALAAQATGMLPLHAGLAHIDICMRVAAEAKQKNRFVCLFLLACECIFLAFVDSLRQQVPTTNCCNVERQK